MVYGCLILHRCAEHGRCGCIGAYAKTVLYSKYDVSGFLNDSNVRLLDKTEAFDFLDDVENNQALIEALEKAYGEIPDFDDYDSPAGQFIGGIDGTPRTPGAWDTISRNFVKAGSGEVLFLVDENAKMERVFFQTEWDTIQEFRNYNKINGVSANSYLISQNMGFSEKQIFDAMKIDTKARILAGGDITAVTVEQMAEQVKSTDMQKFLQESDFAKLNVANPSDIKYVSKFFKGLGIFGAATGFSIASYQAGKLISQGNKEGGEMVMAEFAAEEVGGTIGGSLGAVLGGVALTIVGTVSAPVAAVVIVGATLSGAFIGTEVASQLVDKWFGDSAADDLKTTIMDNLAKFQYIDKDADYIVVEFDQTTDTWIFPAGYTYEHLQTEGADGFAAMLTVLLENGRTPETLPSVILEGQNYGRVRYYAADPAAEDLVSAVRSGDETLLEQLIYARPFGFENIRNNPAEYSLDVEDYSDSFLEQKAALFVNSVYDSEWYHWGGLFGYDAHYIDIDGGVDVGNSLQDKVYFGGNKINDTIEGSLLGGDDHLYGMGGNDTIKGHDGNDYIEGGKGQDTVYGGSGEDTFYIQGEDEDYDIFNGGDDEDTIEGSEGNDTIRLHKYTGENTVEIIDGKGGENKIAGTEKTDVIDLSGTKLIDITEIRGGAGGDTITGSIDNDKIYGEGENDTLSGGGGEDWLYGGSGIDTYIIGEGVTHIVDEDNNGVIQYEDAEGVKQLLGGVWEKQEDGSYKHLVTETIATLSGSTFTIQVGEGKIAKISDFEPGRFGIKLIEEEEAAEDPTVNGSVIHGDYESIWYTSDSGSKYHKYDDLDNVIVDSGKPEPGKKDVLYDSALNDQLHGHGGVDWLHAYRGGDDFVDGGTGDDWIEKGNGGVGILVGSEGSDAVFGDTGGDTLFADTQLTQEEIHQAYAEGTSSGDRGDLLSGQQGNDTLYGWHGNDVLSGGLGNDYIYGGAGNDDIDGDSHISWYSATSPWKVTRTIETDGNTTIYKSTYSGGIVFGPDDFTEHGDDIIYAGLGADWVSAGGGNDFVDGGADDDVVFGEEGDDIILGGTGNDNLNGDSAVTTAEDSGNDYIDGGAGDDKISGGEKDDILLGRDGDDSIFGDYSLGETNGNDYIDGGNGSDTISGGGKDDTVYGGEGDDYLWGDTSGSVAEEVYHGDDHVYGEAGNDQIIGDGGSDNLFGGDGDDNIWGDKAGTDQNSEYNGQDFIDGGAGKDYIVAGGSNDIVFGGAGDDVIYGDAQGINDVRFSKLRDIVGIGSVPHIASMCM